MNRNIVGVTMGAIRKKPILALCFLLQWALTLALSTEHAYAQRTPIPITVNIQFLNVDHQHGTATLMADEHGIVTCSGTPMPPVVCSSFGSEASLAGPLSFADVKLTQDQQGNWTIMQTTTSPNGGTAAMDVHWNLPSGTARATGTLSAQFTCPNPNFPCGANAQFLWGAGTVTDCLFVSPFNYGPQGTCQTHYGDPSFKLPVSVSTVPLGRSFVECIGSGGVCNAMAVTDIAVGCDLVPHVEVKAAPPISFSLQNTSIIATFNPHTSDGTKLTIAQAASSCDFMGFNFQQKMLVLPGPSAFHPNIPGLIPGSNINSKNGSLQAPPAISDPINGGYQPSQNPAGYDPYPFYYLLSELQGPQRKAALAPDDYTIRQIDQPADLCLTLGPLGTPIRQQLGCDPPNPAFDHMEFETQLVGVGNDNPASPSVTPLFHWTWRSNFTGIVGGIQQLASSGPLVPSAGGTGGITITDLNGVPQTSPTLSCTATPNTLWPPDGKSVLVTVAGSITPGTQPLADGTYSVVDKYGQDQPSGSFAPDAQGGYSFQVPLTAARDGNDFDGRTYIIVVASTDAIGNVGACSAQVTVPHDQGN